MSVEHMAMVFAAQGIGGSEKLLLLAYTNYTDPHGYCWPGEDRLAEDTGTSVSTVRRTKKSLTEAKLIKSVRRPETTNLTRVNLSLLASMARPKRVYDDNLLERISFDRSDATPSSPPSDLRTVQSDLDQVSDCSEGGVNLTCATGQSEPLSISDPSVDSPEIPNALTARSANEARRASTGSSGASTRGSAASGKSRHRLTKAEYEAIKAVRSLLPDDLEAKLPVKTPTNLGAAILAALAAGSPYERTPAQLVEYRVLKRWNGFWARKFYAGELAKGPGGKPSVVGPLLAMLKHQQECGDISCEDRVNIHTGEPCGACEMRRGDRKADRQQEEAGSADDFPQQRPELPLRECHDCGRPIRSAVPALCRDCCEDAKA